MQQLLGDSLRSVLRQAGASNVPDPATFDPNAVVVGPSTVRRMRAFRQFGVPLEERGSLHIFVRPGTYPHVDLDKDGRSPSEDPTDGRPLVISTAQLDSPPLHATVVFTVLDKDQPTVRKSLTIHFHADDVIRAKGVTRYTGGYTRPSHYDGQEVRELIRRRAQQWMKKIHWCSALERY